MKTFTVQQVYEAANFIRCESCGDMTDITTHGVKFVSMDDVESDGTYEVFGQCCDDPYLTAVLLTDQPFFLNDSIDDEASIPANPQEDRHTDVWEYEVTDDLILVLRSEGMIDEAA